MARGFISGVAWGGVLGLGIAAVTLTLSPPPAPPQVDTALSDPPQAPVAAPKTEATSPAPSSATPQAPQAQVAEAPAQDTLAALAPETTAPAQTPVFAEPSGLTAPQPPQGAAPAQPGADDPVLPNPQGLAPMSPPTADAVTIATAPAEPRLTVPDEAPDVRDDLAIALPTPTEAIAAPQIPADSSPAPSVTASPALSAPQTAEALGPEPEAPPAPTPTTVAPENDDEPPVLEAQADEASEGAEEEKLAQTQTDEVPEGTEEASVEQAQTDEALQNAEEAPAAPPQTLQAPESADAAPEPQPAPSLPAAPGTLQTAPAQTAENTSRPSIGRPAVSLTDRAGGIAIRRPGAAGVARVALPQEAPAQPSVETPTPSDTSERTPFEEYAVAFANTTNKPLMGLVLIDDGTSPVSGTEAIVALEAFPHPLTFAVDSGLSDAASRMELYRATGSEVLAQVDLPQGALPTDAETALNATFAQFPKVIGVLEGTGGGLQPDREVSDQVTAILDESGYGLLTQSKGLNSMPAQARREGVPAAAIFRDLDSKGQTATVIRRFLDQAAFRAGQEEGVILVARLRPDTISALILWGLQDRIGNVTIAPVSAVLRDKLR